MVSRTRRAGLTFVASLVFAAGADAAPPFSYQPITLKRVALPRAITSAGWPVFTHDGQHLLFFSTHGGTIGGNTGTGLFAELWITGLDGTGARCLSCGVPNDPLSLGEGEIAPFPDGKRAFFGSFFQPGDSFYGVLECAPSLVDCRHRTILPVDFTPAQPKLIPPGGALSLPQVNIGGAYGAKLAQDGVHVGFSDIRLDSVETMVVGTLTRGNGSYSVRDPRVLNPPGPASPSDPDAAAWADAGALYEFKTFTNGGADATYVQVGGAVAGNPDVWSVNLATGRRTRITAHPDYDEDNAGSPDGSLQAMWSNRTMHMTDWYGGLLPVRGFIDAPAALMALSLSSSNKLCHGPIWLMPGGGDDGGKLLGQPIVDDSVPHVFVTNNLTGWPQWSPDSTMLALNTTDESTSNYPAHAPYLLVAQLPARRPSTPLPVVSSAPGAWSLAPAQYHPVFGFAGARTFPGPGGGSVTVDYGLGTGVLIGQWSATYRHYSEDGRSFVDGTIRIAEPVLQQGTYSVHLRMTGTHTASTDVDYSTLTGKVRGTSTYDGHTVSGPSAEQVARRACPGLRPKAPALHVSARRIGPRRYRLRVSVSLPDAGATEGLTDTRAVRGATVSVGRRRVRTDGRGIARVAVARRGATVQVTAGDTLKPAAITLR